MARLSQRADLPLEHAANPEQHSHLSSSGFAGAGNVADLASNLKLGEHVALRFGSYWELSRLRKTSDASLHPFPRNQTALACPIGGAIFADRQISQDFMDSGCAFVCLRGGATKNRSEGSSKRSTSRWGLQKGNSDPSPRSLRDLFLALPPHILESCRDPLSLSVRQA